MGQKRPGHRGRHWLCWRKGFESLLTSPCPILGSCFLFMHMSSPCIVFSLGHLCSRQGVFSKGLTAVYISFLMKAMKALWFLLASEDLLQMALLLWEEQHLLQVLLHLPEWKLGTWTRKPSPTTLASDGFSMTCWGKGKVLLAVAMQCLVDIDLWDDWSVESQLVF